jgi:hypothetical protein
MTTFPRMNDEPLENRGRLMRSALIYTPITLFCLAFVFLAIYQIAAGETGFIFMLVIFGIIAFLTGFQAVQFIQDLSRKPVEYQGEVIRKWHKGNFLIFFMPSFYLAIDSRTLRGRVSRVEDRGVYINMENGDEGFCALKELGLGMERAKSALDMVTPGEEVKYKVLGIDKKGGYRLSTRRVEEEAFVTRLFTISRVEYAMLLEKDLVRVVCYPHSSTVERIERYDEAEKKFIPATSGASL